MTNTPGFIAFIHLEQSIILFQNLNNIILQIFKFAFCNNEFEVKSVNRMASYNHKT